MSVLDAPINVTVEGTAKILRGQLVPYNTPSLVGDRDPTGKLVVYRERFDRDSLVIPSTMIPLLQSHDETRPIGKVTNMWHTDAGLQLEAELIGSSSEVEGLRERIGHGVMSALSIGFFADSTADIWQQATTPGGTPSVTRRGARVKEASLVIWPAYPGAKVFSLRNRTENQLKSDRILGEYRARKDAERAEVEQFLAEQRARKQQRHEESERLKREVAELRQASERIDADVATRRRRSYR